MMKHFYFSTALMIFARLPAVSGHSFVTFSVNVIFIEEEFLIA